MHIQLANGQLMPRIGLGVYKMTDPEDTMEAILAAFEAGYRAIDTASYYFNEEVVGEAIKQSNLPREDLFITTKVWNDDQGYDETLRAFEKSLKLLGLDYIDLYLTHWPVPGKFVDTYLAIERLYEEKLIRVPGVSNHHEKHLKKIQASAKVMPMVNQIELHPYLQQKNLREFCAERKIAVTAWAPLGRGTILSDPRINSIANSKGKTPAQIILKWHLQLGNIVIPKSITPSRIRENISLHDFELTDEEMNEIKQLDREGRTGANPESENFMDHFNK